MKYILAVDQGTTSTRAIVFDEQAQPLGLAQQKITQFFPQSGWVEHDAEEIWQSVLHCCHQAIKAANIPFEKITAIGITNQRETTVIWDKKTGKPIYPAIVWQDRRTTKQCETIKKAISESIVQEKTGLLIDPYFSATKIAWILDHIPDARQRAAKNELAFGTIDCFLLWKLTQGKRHATDITNASRTLLFNIHTGKWDTELLNIFKIPINLLPEVLENCAAFGKTDVSLFEKEIPITAMAGDQQASLVGQACFNPGMIKSTYGTGTFLMLNTGTKLILSQHRLLSTIAYQLNGQITYALEGSIFASGSAIQWLRDKLGLIKTASESETLASRVNDNGGVYFVPAFTGLGAPFWDPHARAAILGLTRDSNVAHIVRAALESVAFRTRDLVDLMAKDITFPMKEIRVDGGMVVNNWLMQFLADILNIPVEQPKIIETTALGVAYLAGLGAGIYSSLDQIAKLWRCERRFEPQMSTEIRQQLYSNWQAAIKKILS